MDSPLTFRGIRQAQALARRLENTTFGRIYTSPSPRAVHTAEILRTHRDIPLVRDACLFEMDLGLWEGRTRKELQRDHPVDYDRFWNYPDQFQPQKGESFFEVHQRALAFVNRIRRLYSGHNILIVTHAVVLKCLITHFMGKPLRALWEEPYVHGASLTVVNLSDRNPRIEVCADTSHLVGV